MNRRRALAIGLGLCGAGAGGLWRLVRLRERRPGQLIDQILRETFPYLRIASADREFAREFLERAPLIEVHIRRLRAARSWEESAELEQTLAEAFLLSTDFFRNGADESRPMKFVALYAPRYAGCQNPFARFDID